MTWAELEQRLLAVCENALNGKKAAPDEIKALVEAAGLAHDKALSVQFRDEMKQTAKTMAEMFVPFPASNA